MYGERRPEFDPDRIMRNLGSGWAGFRGRLPRGGLGLLFGGVFLVVAALWAISGVYQVGPEEQAALRLFGKFQGTEGPGLHFYYPSPIGSRNVEPVLETKTLELGFRADPARDVPVESLMITGDLNIVDTKLVVQYRISDLEKFLFEVDDPGDADRDAREGRPDGRTLRDATEAALRQVVGQRSIDDVLTVAKEEVQEDAKILLQTLLDDYGSGLLILSLSLQEVRPPDAVRASFDDVVAARSDKETRVNQANAFEQDRVPRAQGAAAQTVQAAEGFKQSRIARAEGEAAEFLAILKEYKESPEVTRQRLFLESMEEILPGVTIFVLDSGAGGVLPFLPLTGGVPDIPTAPGTGQDGQ